MRRLMDRYLDLFTEADCLDPCVGDGVIPATIDACYRSPALRPRWTVCDIDPAWAVDPVDYLDSDVPDHPYSIAIFNPPFSRAVDFVRLARLHCDHVFCLQRLNWISSQQRHPFFVGDMPDIEVLPNRPSFRPDGKTDSQEYAWYYWGDHTGMIRLLDLTPLKERRSAA